MLYSNKFYNLGDKTFETDFNNKKNILIKGPLRDKRAKKDGGFFISGTSDAGNRKKVDPKVLKMQLLLRLSEGHKNLKN